MPVADDPGGRGSARCLIPDPQGLPGRSFQSRKVRTANALAAPPACLTALAALTVATCATNHPAGPPPPDSIRAAAFLDTLEERTFHYFWDLTNPTNGLTPDRSASGSFSSIAAVGFALTAYPIAVERGYITRAQAAGRTLTTLRFFWTAPQDSAAAGVTGYKGFFYHFLDMNTGQRFQAVELSTIDTALLLAGVL